MGLDNSFKYPIISHERLSIFGKEVICFNSFFESLLRVSINNGSKAGNVFKTVFDLTINKL